MTEGAFRVSAIRRDGRTVWVRIVAGVDRQLRVRDPFAGEACTIEGAASRREGDDIVADLAAGQEIMMQLDGVEVDPAEALAAVRSSSVSLLGLR